MYQLFFYYEIDLKKFKPVFSFNCSESIETLEDTKLYDLIFLPQSPKFASPSLNEKKNSRNF